MNRGDLVLLLVKHWPTNSAACACGGVQLGQSWPHHVADLLAEQDKPLLGLATTRELLAELTARIETDVAGKGLDYRTVGSHE